jgi:hypothetical protein
MAVPTSMIGVAGWEDEIVVVNFLHNTGIVAGSYNSGGILLTWFGTFKDKDLRFRKDDGD